MFILLFFVHDVKVYVLIIKDLHKISQLELSGKRSGKYNYLKKFSKD